MLRIKQSQHYIYIGLLAAIAIIINLIECYFIPPIQFGIRFGLANIIALLTLALFGPKELIYVNILRVMLGGLLRGIIFGASFWISLGGIICSSIGLILCFKAKCSMMFSSLISSILHTTGQVIVVAFLYQETLIFSLLPVLVISSILTGLLTGYIAKECIKRVRIC